MTKIKVQDATKELSTGAGKLCENMVGLRKQSQEALGNLRKLAENFAREERERKEQAAQEELKRKYEAAQSFLTAYSSQPAVDESQSSVESVPENPKVQTEGTSKPESDQGNQAPADNAPAEAEPSDTAAEAKSISEEKSQHDKADNQKVAAKAEEQSAPSNEDKTSSVSPLRVVKPAPQPGQQSQQPAQARRSQQPAQNTQRYGRPVQSAQNQQPAQNQQRYGRPVQPAQGQQLGQQRYGRPAQPGQYRQGQQQPGQQRYGRSPSQGGGQFQSQQGSGQGRSTGGQQRSGGQRSAFSRKIPDLTPSMEKERVSNYDPNKKQYARQNDPERMGNKRRQRVNAVLDTGYDDDDVRGSRRRKTKTQPKVHIEPVKIEKAYMTAETITVRDLTERIGKPAGEIIKKLMMIGIIATINEELDFDTAQLVSSEFGVELEMKLAETAEDVLAHEEIEDQDEDLEPRPPVVTIMGHVDHGKTSLLDYIRNSRVTASEAGGITQHIGAYTVDLNGQQITFLDTPGHEAFTAMRMRGAQATDIAVLVVAADDGVMPQTIEAINHAKAADVQIIVAINKIDKPTANIDRIKQQLTEYGLVAEEWGGDTIMVPVSAVTGEGVDNLLEMILLVAEVQDYRANPNRKARGIIIEARLDKGRGPVSTVLVKTGTLHVGDTIVAGTAYGRVRAMTNDRGERVKVAGPSDPVEVVGFNDVPSAGDTINAVDDDKLSRQVAEERKDKLRAALIKTQQKTSLDDLFNQISAGQIKDLNIIIKADVQGSVEAVRQSLEKLSNDEVRVNPIHGGVGAITETDVMLASASNAIIIGFNVRPDNNARDVAEREKVDIRLYRVIYNAIEDVQNAMKGLLAPKFKEVLLGHAQVRQTFKVSGVGTIAGSYVTDGKILRNAQIRLLRDNVVILEGKIDSLKRYKDDAKEVNTGYECGIGIENFNDVKEGDVIECFIMEELEQ